MKRIISLLLALVMSLSLLPLFASASETTEAIQEATEITEATEPEAPKTYTVKVKVMVGTKTLYTYDVKVGDKDVTLKNDLYMEYKDKYYKYSVYKVSGKKTHTVKIPAYDGTKTWEKKWGNTIQVVYTTHKHKYKPGYNRIYHWSICACGKTTNEVRHVDPATDIDKICTCGYEFNDNAQITTLWFADMNISPRFTKDIYEYTAETVTWKDVTSTSITAKPFDALAKIELPEDLTIREGANKFEIKVTAEDRTTTQIYTVMVMKPAKVENTLITTDMTTVSAKLKVTLRNQCANAAVTDAVCTKFVAMAALDKAPYIALCPEFSKWGPPKTEITVTGAQLKSIADQSEADLQVKTPWEVTLTIPHAELAALADGHETLIFRVAKDGTFAILADGEALAVPNATTADISQEPPVAVTEPIEIIPAST